MKKYKNKRLKWVQIGIFIVFSLIHCYRIGEIPYGINVDEMGMGYDAWCLSNYGTDRYLNSFPVYLINFSGGQSAMYAYLCAPFVYFLGISAGVLRIPAMIFSFISLIFIIKIINRLWNNENVNTLAMFLYTICPVFLMLSRIGLDCNLMLGMSIIFIYTLLNAIERNNNISYLIAGVSGGLLLYSYVISHMVLPLFLLLLIVYLLYINQVSWKKIIYMAIPLFIFAVPLMLMHYINMFGLEEFQIGFLTIPKLYRYRNDDLSVQIVGDNLLRFFGITLLHDNVDFNSVPKYGNMYYISVPFIIIGIFHYAIIFVNALKEKQWKKQVVILLWMISIYLVGILLSDGGPNVYRVNGIFIAYFIFLIDGLCSTFKFFSKKKYIVAKYVACLCTCIYCSFFCLFICYYFCDYARDTYLIDLFNFKFDNVLEYIENELPDEVSDRTTYIGDANQTYIYFLGGETISPYEYNELPDDEPYTLWIWTQKYKNFEFNFPEEINPMGNYIVPETSTEYVKLYEEYGFEKVHIGTHYLFWNSMLNQKESNAEAIISWDHGVEQGKITLTEHENIVLSGWAINSTCGTVWDDVIVYVNGEYYVAEKMDRTDVASVLENEDMETCGFHITIPRKKIIDNKVIVYFIDYSRKVCHIEKLNTDIG